MAVLCYNKCADIGSSRSHLVNDVPQSLYRLNHRNQKMLSISAVKAQLNDEVVQTVNARDLHKWLESKQDFSTWIKRRIKQCQFIENVDYMLLHQKVEQVSGAKYMNEYFISFDMAKHLCMLEKTTKGHNVRMYFIEQEKIARNISNELMSQFNRAVLEFEKISDLASQAGRTLNFAGKKLKPQALEKVEALKIKIQPDIFID
jgi:anti-repressor protein